MQFGSRRRSPARARANAGGYQTMATRESVVIRRRNAMTSAMTDELVRIATADTRSPAVALLSNGRYGVMITAAGAGYSSWRDLDVTRWREDGTRDCWGQFCYVRDLGDRK